VKCQCLKATIENNKTSIKTYFKKLTTGNNDLLSQLLSKVGPNCRILRLSHEMFNVSTLLLDKALLNVLLHKAYKTIEPPCILYALRFNQQINQS